VTGFELGKRWEKKDPYRAINIQGGGGGEVGNFCES